MCSELPLINYDNLWGLHQELGESLVPLLDIFDGYLPRWSDHIRSACLRHDCHTLIYTVRALRNFSLLLHADRLVCMSDQLCEMMQDQLIDEELINALLIIAKETQQVLKKRVSDFMFFKLLELVCEE